ALALLVIVRSFIANSTQHSPILKPFGDWSTLWASMPLVVLVGVVLSALASFLTLRRHLRV
ncbi:MAG TPA: hypothetical protein VME70_09635, partial [Mycobacteriales bacterium]|nr:hypothetical protein [Mycobacteriales bacterium]